MGKQTWSQRAKPLWRVVALLAPGKARLQQLLSKHREQHSQGCWLRGHPAGDILLPSRELNPAGRGRCQHPAWQSMGGMAGGAGRGCWGGNTPCARSSVSLNHTLVWKHGLLAAPAAWHGGENSFGHRCACSEPPLCARQDTTACKVQPLESPAGTQSLLRGHGCCHPAAAAVWRLSLAALQLSSSLLCKQLMEFGCPPHDPALLIYRRSGRFVGERSYQTAGEKNHKTFGCKSFILA